MKGDAARASPLRLPFPMPVAVSTAGETSSRHSEDRSMDGDHNILPTTTMYGSPDKYDFPKLEGKDPHEQACSLCIFLKKLF